MNFQGYFTHINHNRSGLISMPYMQKVLEQDNLGLEESYQIYNSESCDAANEIIQSDREKDIPHDIEANDMDSGQKLSPNDTK